MSRDGTYARLCSFKKKWKGMKQGAVKIVVREEDLTSQFQITFYVVFYLSTSIVRSVG